jgi:hypothetical protein
MFARRARPAAVLAVFACAAGLAVPVGAAAAPAPVPPGFVGMNFDGPLYPNTAPGVNLADQMRTMVSSGVESIRAVFDWSYAQPYSSWSQVPAADTADFTNVGGIPTRFGELDQLVGLAAAHGLTILPTILYAPAWDATGGSAEALAIPRKEAPYANFAAALVRRYGPDGTFWQTHSPAVPIREWQIWNEPSIRYFWPVQPYQKGYVALLRAAHNAIKAADPSAKVVLAGIPNNSWAQLQSMYEIKGTSKLFDVVAVHPYTKYPQGVITILQKVRNTMNSFGDTHKPIIASELSWPSSSGQTHQTLGLDIGTTEAGQANKVAAVLPLLGTYRTSLKLAGFDYYTWATTDPHGADLFDFAGLFHFDSNSDAFKAKPAVAAFKRGALALERCNKKGSIATVCSQPK